MPVIGVDISGQVGVEAPVYCVAVKLSRRSKQTHKIVCLSKEKHDEYANYTRNWREKLSSILIFRAVVEIYSFVDVIVIDTDFEGERRRHVERCLRRLFGERFVGQYPLTSPNILFQSARSNKNVKEADLKSKLARHRSLAYDFKDLDFSKEFSWLDNL